MYQGKRISVAMATYNGERFLEQQLDSILAQTVLPDEIVISDDGSEDRTLEIAKRYAEENIGRIKIDVRTDNLRHGVGGNFTWAIEHCTGDYIFICGQDDLWIPEKVRKIIDVFLSNPNAEAVCHELKCIDAEDSLIKDTDSYVIPHPLDSSCEEIVHLERKDYMARMLSSVFINGPALCISRRLSEKCLPIPSNNGEEQWIEFCAVADNQLFFVRKCLTFYRIHYSTTHSNGVPIRRYLSTIPSKIRGAFLGAKESIVLLEAAERYVSGIDKLDPKTKEQTEKMTEKIHTIASALLDILNRSSLLGAFLLCKLYQSDSWYHNSGRKQFVLQLLCLLIYSKRKRRQMYQME